ncbi:hypothetical protein [Salinispora oceanensis]|uniref:hypothetical protein n=1 Tax=Salinispora oceanensis TaxID=1050199 RepID=UPI000375052D|nr:hypothetical protein [Salinispora oceanensis]
MVLVWFRKAEDVARLGAGFDVSRATTYRYRDDGIAVLAAQAPDLHTTLRGWPTTAGPISSRTGTLLL